MFAQVHCSYVRPFIRGSFEQARLRFYSAAGDALYYLFHSSDYSEEQQTDEFRHPSRRGGELLDSFSIKLLIKHIPNPKIHPNPNVSKDIIPFDNGHPFNWCNK